MRDIPSATENKFSKSKKKVKVILSKIAVKKWGKVHNATMASTNQINGDSLKVRKLQNFTTTALPSWGNSDYSTAANYENNYNFRVKDGRYKSEKMKTIDENPREKLKSKKMRKSDDEDVSCFSVDGLAKNIKQYLQKSSLHGLRYIGDGHLSWIERFFWLGSALIAMVVAAYFISNIYERWRIAPMIIFVNPQQAQLTSIPFPAVTICNMNQARKEVAQKILKEGSAVDKKLLEGLCKINSDAVTLDLDSSAKVGKWEYYKQFLINVTQPCSQLIAACRWRSEPRSCELLFNPTLTDEGLCCTFNSVHREIMFRNPRDMSDLNVTFPFPRVDWSPENGYPPNSPYDGFPWRPIGTGANLGLTLLLDANIDDYYCSSTSSEGFKILLHNPAETPKITDFGDFIMVGEEQRMVVNPRIYDAQGDLRHSIAVNKRKCVFGDEQQLVYFRLYTKKNCVMECEARLTIQKCNCSQFYMPKNSSVRICGMADQSCYTELKVAIEDKLGVNESNLMLNTNCDQCFPACFELSYGKEVSSARLTSVQFKEDNLTTKSSEYFRLSHDGAQLNEEEKEETVHCSL